MPLTQVLRRLENFVDGEWVESGAAQGKEIRNPATGELIARAPFSTKEEVQGAIRAARNAFPDWKETPPVSRARHLFTLKELLEKNFEDLARTIVTEHGKTLDEARGEVRRGIENVEVAAGIPSLLTGYSLEDVASGIDERAVRQPLGVFCVVPPYNFPLMVPLWFIPYGVACGNAMIVKPSEQVPLTLNKLFHFIDEAGFPPGVVNLVNGAKEAVDALLESPDIRGVSFVGSTNVAREIYAKATAAGKRAQCQGGAKNFVAVMPDADLDKTVPSLVTSFYGCSGQRCLAGSVLLAVGSAAEPLKKKFVEAASKIRVGNGMDEGVGMGPVVSAAHKERVLGWIETGLREGADLVLDGRGVTVDGHPKGHFIGPCVFDNVRSEMSIAREEIFGPVASIVRVRDLDEAIGIIDRNPYGNAASIYTSSGKAAREFKRRVECGNIGVNVGVPAPIAFFPFGGMKNSFFGDLHGQGREGIDFFTDRKVLIERWL